MYSPKDGIERAYRVRLKLTHRQTHTLHRLFGAARFVWNWALETRTTAYRERGESLNWVALSARFTQLKQTPETTWLAALPREPFNQVLRDQEKAFSAFFGKRAKYPRFRRRGQHEAVRFTLDQRRTQVDRAAGTVLLPGLGTVRFKNSYGTRADGGMLGRLRSVSVSRDAGGRYFASFTADRVPAPPVAPAPEPAVGIDLGLGQLAVLSTGETVVAPKALTKKLQRLRRYQRRACRQRDAGLRALGLDPAKPIPKGTRIPLSNRAKRTRQRLGQLHARIGDGRREALHQASHALTRRFSVVCLEDLNVKALARGMGRRAFRRSVADAGLGELRRQLAYKAAWRGRTVVTVDRFYPSSQHCSGCGHQHKALKLKDRHWTCPACGTAHDRDHNAAKNILAEGLRILGATPRSGGSEGQALDARGETPRRGVTSVVTLTRPDSMNREPVRSRTAADSRARRRER